MWLTGFEPVPSGPQPEVLPLHHNHRVILCWVLNEYRTRNVSGHDRADSTIILLTPCSTNTENRTRKWRLMKPLNVHRSLLAYKLIVEASRVLPKMCTLLGNWNCNFTFHYSTSLLQRSLISFVSAVGVEPTSLTLRGCCITALPSRHINLKVILHIMH